MIASFAWTIDLRMAALTSSALAVGARFLRSSRGMMSIASLLAISPAACPPIPSATMHTDSSGNCLTSIESSLFSR